MRVLVFWKNGEHEFFYHVGNVEFTSENPSIMCFIKDNEDYIFVNMNEVLYVEEETK